MKCEVWAQFQVSKKSVKEIHDFFIFECSIPQDYLIFNLHLTVYHARRPLSGLMNSSESCQLFLDTNFTRFMVQAPGGENPKPHLIPAERKIGIRVQRISEFRAHIDEYRRRFYSFETKEVLGARSRSNSNRSAFGSRSFQPHIALIKPGSGVSDDLTEIGVKFRDAIPEIVFDRFDVCINQLELK
jgi:hypothetical protein